MELITKVEITKETGNEIMNQYSSMLKKNTKRAYLADIEDFLATVNGFTLQSVIDYFHEVAMKYAESTLNRKKAALSNFFTFLVEMNKIDSNPFKTTTFRNHMKLIVSTANKDHVSKKPPKHNLADSEIDRMLATTTDGIRGMRDRMIVSLGASEGLRRSEIAELKWSDISSDSTGYTLRIRGSKNGKIDHIKLFEGVYNELAALKDEYERYNVKSDYIIVSLSGNGLGAKLTSDNVNKIVKTLAKKAAVNNAKEITAHDLRHTFAVRLYKAGVQLPSISKMLRHKDIKTTSVYLETLNIYQDEKLNELAW